MPLLIHACLVAASLTTADPVVLDGTFDDWGVVDGPTPALQGARDAQWVYLHLQIDGAPVNLQGLDEPAVLLLNIDGDTKTGSRNLALNGADLEIVFSPKQGRRSGGAQVRLGGGDLATPDAIDFLYAPTTAATQFEMRIPRDIAIADSTMAVAEVVPWAIAGSLGSASGEITLHTDRPSPTSHVNDIPATVTGGTRVVSWNVEFGGLIENPDPFVRILSALQPDVLLLQELEPDQEADAIAAVLRRGVPGDWHVHLGPVGGRLRSAVASRLPAAPIPMLDALQRRDTTDRGVRAASLAVEVPGTGRVLMTSLHLKCCGSAHGPEDMTRIAEVLAVKQAVAAAHAHTPFDAAVIGGDLNLVGSTVPLDLLTMDGEAMLGGVGDLAVANAMRPAGGGLQTWNKDGQRYTPGRLDWITYTAASVHAAHAFVLATDECTPEALQRAGLKASDAEDAADHLPVVVDLVPAVK
ncbi:MAG: endonuclease/exonuclease/phosphatase family protein [Phycisphaerales bacterium]|nr:endonuclease/exonuclease/phosphatase family protein [Phycisphaerales bacterium]